jgi:hypothetical protein
VDQLCEDWLDAARQCGIPVHDQDGEPPAEVLDAIERTIAAAIWFGITTGHLTLTGSYDIPSKLAEHV